MREYSCRSTVIAPTQVGVITPKYRKNSRTSGSFIFERGEGIIVGVIHIAQLYFQHQKQKGSIRKAALKQPCE